MPISESELDELTHEAVELLRSLVRIPSLSKEESGRADYLCDYLKQKGFDPIRSLNNIILDKGNASKPKLLLNSHIDTVKPVSTWNLNPYEPIIQHGNLYGLGTNDAGASVVTLLMAYQYLSGSDQPYDMIYAATAEEEISGQNGIASILNDIKDIDLAIVGEPTGMQMAIAEKGLMVIDAVAMGISGHAARHEGKNAIYIALADIERIINYLFDKESDLLGSTKATVTMIQAGSQHNVIPDRCEYVIDVRSNEWYTNEEIYNLLKGEVESILTPRSFRLNSSKIKADHPIVLKGTQMGLTSYGSPTLSDQALMPFTSIKIGPGASSRSHTADEYIKIEEIRLGIKTYIELLDGLNIIKQ